MHSLAVNVLDAKDLIASWGTVGLILIIFAETGLLFGFFFPGDTVLFLAGAFAASSKAGDPHISLGPLLVGVAIAAILGAQVGYLIGRKAGPVFFDRPRSRLFNPKNVERASEVLHRYGEWKAIFLARFIPVVRTFMNPVCGVAQVPVKVFTMWNIIGGLVWTIGVTLLGYALGSSINIDKYIIPITLVIVLLSVIPIVLEARKSRARTAAAIASAEAGSARTSEREDVV
jgi:membrane-associated protein